jgi:hypothetical protein
MFLSLPVLDDHKASVRLKLEGPTYGPSIAFVEIEKLLKSGVIRLQQKLGPVEVAVIK